MDLGGGIVVSDILVSAIDLVSGTRRQLVLAAEALTDLP
jgi:hypothetical protein